MEQPSWGRGGLVLNGQLTPLVLHVKGEKSVDQESPPYKYLVVNDPAHGKQLTILIICLY